MINILHMKYAVEVAKTGSVNKAAESLIIAQPNLSRSIKELEADLGITIFERSPKGMTLTSEGEDFINHAGDILKQIQEMEQRYKEGIMQKQKFSISVPRATYIAEAFAHFSRNINPTPAEVYYMETNSYRTVENVLSGDYKLGIVRYSENYDKYFKEYFEEKNLHAELVSEFHYMLIMSKNSPLAKFSEIHDKDLSHFIEIAHADPYVPSLPLAEVKRTELSDICNRKIFVFERGGQFDLLAENPETFMWVSPLTDKMLNRYDLIQVNCPDNQKNYRDVLIYRKDYVLSDLDKKFITDLCMTKRKYL